MKKIVSGILGGFGLGLLCGCLTDKTIKQNDGPISARIYTFHALPEGKLGLIIVTKDHKETWITVTNSYEEGVLEGSEIKNDLVRDVSKKATNNYWLPIDPSLQRPYLEIHPNSRYGSIYYDTNRVTMTSAQVKDGLWIVVFNLKEEVK